MIRYSFTPVAADDLEGIWAFIADDSVAAADRVIEDIRRAVRRSLICRRWAMNEMTWLTKHSENRGPAEPDGSLMSAAWEGQLENGADLPDSQGEVHEDSRGV